MSTFNQPAAIPEASLAKSAHINDLSSAIKNAFDALPNETKLALETVNYLTATGTVNTYAVTMPGIASYIDGMKVVLNVPVSNTGLSTLNVNGLGPIEIRSLDSVSLSTGVLQAGIPTEIRYSVATGYFHVFVQASAPITGSLLIVNALAELGALAETARINIGLGNVNNTSDANKPVSTATQNALNFKLDLSTLPTITSANSGQSLLVNAAGNGYITDSFAKGFRNKLLNGDFQVWQRGITLTDPIPTNFYGADRWGCVRHAFDAGMTVTQQSTQTNSKSMRVQRTAGNASTSILYIAQTLETQEVKKLAGKQVTLSFKLLKGANFSATSNIVQILILAGTGTDGNLITVSFTGQTIVANLNQVITDTSTLYTATGTVPANATQLGVWFQYTPVAGAAGAADYFEITDVQLEEGSVATPFERRSYGLELALCQRFFRRLVNNTGSHSIGNGVAISATGMQLQRYLDIEMRIAPALVLSSAADFIAINGSGGSAGTATAITLSIAKTNFVRFDVTVASGLTAGNAASCQSQNTSATLDLNAEL